MTIALASLCSTFGAPLGVAAAAKTADGLIGQATYSTNSPQTSSTGFNYPMGGVVDKAGSRLFVLEKNNHRVLVFNTDSSGVPLDGIADNVLGQTGFTGSSPDTTQSTLRFPSGLALDSTTNYLYVADFANSRVMVFDVASITNGENAVAVLGQPNFTSNGAALSASTMNSPGAVAVDSANKRLFAVDRGNNRVLVFDTTTVTTGMSASSVLGQTNMTSSGQATSADTLWTPSGATVDSSAQRLYVSDLGNNRILAYNTSSITSGMSAIGILGQSSFASRAGGTSAVLISGPGQLAINPSSKILYVPDYYNSRVLAYDVATLTNGEPAADVFGQPDFTTATTGITSSTMDKPEAVMVDTGGGRLWVLDSNNNRVLRFDVGGQSTGATFTGQIQPSLTVVIAGLTSGSCNGATITSGSTSTAVDLILSPTANQVAGQSITVTTNANSGYSAFFATTDP